MKIKINIKSIIFMTIIALASLLFINISFAANTGKIIVETVKLREQPNTDAKVLELASYGEEVEVLDKADNWYKVKYKRITGYIRSDLIQVEDKQGKQNETNTTNNANTTEQTNTENNSDENRNNQIEQNTTTENQATENTTSENPTVETNTTPVEKIIEKGKYKLSEKVKLKIIPLISAIELEEVNKDIEVDVIEILNDWVKIKTAEGKEGWVRKSQLAEIQENKTETRPEENKQVTTQTTEGIKPEGQTTNTAKTMYVNTQTINVRQKADKTSQVIKQLTINTQVTVLSNSNGWAYVEVAGIKGYIAETLLSATKQQTSRSATTTRSSGTATTNNIQQTENKTNTNTSANTSTNNKATTPIPSNSASTGKGNSVVAYAKQFLGCKYVYGGTTPKGFDCSGFTQYVYKHFGVNLNRTAAAQYSNGISVTNLQAGDLIMFGKSGINHVGIYIGGNTFIHAANKSRGVTTDTLSSGYYKNNYVGARRIF